MQTKRLTLSSTKHYTTNYTLLHPTNTSCPRRGSHHCISIYPQQQLPQPLALCIRCIDAAQPFDYESRLRARHLESQSLKVGILGFGNFGQFLAKRFASQGHTVIAHSRTNYSLAARFLGVTFYENPDDMCEAHPEVVVLCTSIISTESVLESFPFHRLKRSTLFVDVLSVKVFAKNLMLKHLPAELDILCTHPMFGPASGRGSWGGLPFVYDKVRIGECENRTARVNKFLDIFAKEGCRMVEMSCEEHDHYAAGSQFVTHTMGRVLERFGLESSPINTKGYETLLNLVQNTAGDSFELYYGLFLYNHNAMKQLERLDMAFEAIKKELFGKLHQVYRKQLFEYSDLFDDEKRKKEKEKELEEDRIINVPQKLLGCGSSTGTHVHGNCSVTGTGSLVKASIENV